MANPYNEFLARLGDIRADALFLSRASALYPRMNSAINWTSDADAVFQARQFMTSQFETPDRIYSALLVRAVAAFERFGRLLIELIVTNRTSKVKKYQDVSIELRNRNMISTGKILAQIENPKDHINYSYTELISNLATCREGSDSFIFNVSAFSLSFAGCKSEYWDKALTPLGLKNWADQVCGEVSLQKCFNVTGTRIATTRLKERLDRLAMYRNQLAHGGDSEPAVTYQSLAEDLDFLELVAETMQKKLK